MAPSTRLTIDGETFQVLLSAELVRSGGLADQGQIIPAVETGGNLRRAFWNFSTPMGQSRSYEDGCLTDYVIQLDHRFNGVLTNPPLRNTFSFIAEQPQPDIPIYGAGGVYGEDDVYAGSFTGTGEYIGVQDDGEFIYIVFKGVSAKVNPLTMQIVEYVILTNPATGMFRGQDGKGYVCHGAATAMTRRNTLLTPHSYEAVADAQGDQVQAHTGVTAGSRTFISDPTSKQVSFTVDGFQTLSGQFPIGPSDQDPNGLGAWSGYTFGGYDDQISSFTDAGEVATLLATPLAGLRSDINGAQWAEQWGFNYTLTRRGIFTVSAREYAFVGINSLRDFEAPVTGEPTAITAIGETLMMAHLDADGTTQLVRGEFNPRSTPATGAPSPYAFDTLTGERVVALEPTGLRTQPTLIAVTESGKVHWWQIGGRARDIADPAYQQSASGGRWYGATLMTEPNRVAVARQARFHSESGDWALHLQLDEGAWRMGGEVSGPAYGVVDLRESGFNFHTLKPQLAGGGNLRGFLEIEYLERPETVEEKAYTLVLGEKAKTKMTKLRDLANGNVAAPPATIETPEGETRMGWVTNVQRAQSDDRQTQLPADLVEVTVLLW